AAAAASGATPRRAPLSSRSSRCPRARVRPGARSCARRRAAFCRPTPRWRRGALRSRAYTCMVAATATERALLIDGEWVETGDWVDVRSPYSGAVVGRVAKGGAAETRRALDAAARVLESPLPAHKRAEILVKVAGLIGRRHEEVARTISDEAGKPIKTARVEASRAMSTYTFAAVEARKLAGEIVPMDAAQAGEGKVGFTIRRPIGIVGAISPFNFPCNLVAHKLAPALAAGCPVVLKPASQTPLSALLLAELEL